MRFIGISGLNMEMSRLVMGTAFIYPNNVEEYKSILSEYIKLGGNAFDTAENYGRGESEKALGYWLDKQGIRDEVIIITKGGHPYENKHRITSSELEEDLTGSLERLKTNYVDLYLLHRDDPSVPVQYIIEEMNKFIERGHVKAIGVSNWSHDRIEAANNYAATHNLHGFVCNSPNLSLAQQKEPMWPGSISAGEETKSWHKKTQLPLLSWSAQASGFFSGRFHPNDTSDDDMARVYFTDENWERYNRAKILARKKKCESVEIALAYVLNLEFPTAGVIGPRTLGELHSSVKAQQIELTKEEVQWLNLK